MTLPERSFGQDTRGEIFSRDFNAAYIKSLDAFELKRLIAVYGLEQVNDRIAGRS